MISIIVETTLYVEFCALVSEVDKDTILPEALQALEFDFDSFDLVILDKEAYKQCIMLALSERSLP